ncbi:copper-binding protein [Qipengyuania mesophila]|nr:copper-binding protein [Qipengyuania mesophila]
MRITTLMTALAAPLALSACGPSDDAADMSDMPMDDDQVAMDGADMPMMGDRVTDGGATKSASAEGTVTAIDPEAGTITIDHGPVPATEWPAMTMAFEANQQLRDDVKVGDEVSFEFRAGDEGSVITSIDKK